MAKKEREGESKRVEGRESCVSFKARMNAQVCETIRCACKHLCACVCDCVRVCLRQERERECVLERLRAMLFWVCGGMCARDTVLKQMCFS